MKFRECELCGASLDPGERCTCREEREEEERRAEAERRAAVLRGFLATAPVVRKKKKP